jgi:hypothetical protein
MIAENEDKQNRTKAKPLPPIEYLRELFVVDPTSPSGLRWKVRRRGSRGMGGVAGCKAELSPGKLYWLVGVPGGHARAHRIVWAIVHGSDLDGYQIDHINGDGLDNRIENLRLATSSQNNRNRKTAKNSTTGIRGVCWDAARNKWMAHISVNGKFHNLGRFDSLAVARCVRRRAEVQLFGEFSSIHRKEGA